jgi:ankyrin repeat protein
MVLSVYAWYHAGMGALTPDPRSLPTNTPSSCYVTPLVAALAGGHFQTVKYLYDHGAHLNIPGKFQRTPLHSAAWYGDFEMVQVLLDYKADINARSKCNWTSLHEVSQGRTHFNLSLDSLMSPVYCLSVARM